MFCFLGLTIFYPIVRVFVSQNTFFKLLCKLHGCVGLFRKDSYFHASIPQQKPHHLDTSCLVFLLFAAFIGRWFGDLRVLRRITQFAGNNAPSALCDRIVILLLDSLPLLRLDVQMSFVPEHTDATQSLR